MAALVLSIGLVGHLAVAAGSASATSQAIIPEHNPLVRSPANPLLSRGPIGSFDQVKIGPRAIVREAPTVWKMWYEGAPGGNTSRVGYATSTDGIAWAKYPGSPIMVPTEPWEGAPAGETSPATVLKERGTYKMWYHGFQNGTRRIGYATSADGLTWTKYPGNPILQPGPAGAWDAGSIAEPHVITVNSIYFMYYMHAAGDHGVGLATSPDGITWTKYPGNPVLTKGAVGSWDGRAQQIGGVVYDGEAFHMWFRAVDASFNARLGYAWSRDGKSWTKSPNNPLLAKPNPPLGKGDDFGVESNTNIIRRGADWWIYYGGFVSCCPENVGLNLATSAVKASPNTAPRVDAGADQAIALPGPATLDGTVMDDDVPAPLELVTSTWTKASGPDAVIFANANALDTSARFSEAGIYVLRLTADDGQLSAYDEVSVTVKDNMPSPTHALALTPTASATTTDTRTATPTSTHTYTPAATPTSTPRKTPSATPTISPTATPSLTARSTPTYTPTQTPMSTQTSTTIDTPTTTPIVTLTPTSTVTPTETGAVPTASLTATAATTTSPTVRPQRIDPNCDGRVTAADLPALVHIIATGERASCGLDDANGDGEVLESDVVLVYAIVFS